MSFVCLLPTKFVTSAYITLYAATECNLDTVDEKPSDFPKERGKAQMEWLSGLAHRLVDLVWMPPPQEDINTAAATASRSEVKTNDSCFCGEGRQIREGFKLFRNKKLNEFGYWRKGFFKCVCSFHLNRLYRA